MASFIYDGDCGLCTWVVERLSRSPRGHRIEWVMAQSLDALPAPLTQTDVETAAWFVARGRVHGGVHAFRRLTLLLPVLWAFAPILWLPGMGFVAGFVYRQIAARRRAISTRLGLAACRLRIPDATTAPERTS